MRRGTRVCQAYRNAVTQLTLSCCNTIKYESPGSRRWDASSSGVKCHLHGEEGGVALSISHSPKQRTPGESSCICGVKEKKKESRAGFDQCAAVWSGLSLGAQASQPAPRQPVRPSAGSGLRMKRRSTQGSSSHYADSKPGCGASQWPAHEDAITTVRLKVRFYCFFLFVFVGISYWVYGCITARLTQT